MRFLAVLFVFAACGPTGGSNNSGGSGGSNSGGSGGMYAGGSGGSTGTGGSGGSIDNNPDAMDCGEQTFMLQRLPPDLLIVQDQSGSMMDPPSAGGASKWSQMTGAINMSLSTSQAQQARWGIVFFPNDGACGAATTPDVPVGNNTQSQIQSSLSSHSPNGATPTQAAVRAATSYLMGLTDSNPKFIVLATDGEPNCGSGGFGDDAAGAEQAITDAKNMGINTFVIGISADSTSDATLNQMAMNGGEARPNGPPSYYSVQNQTDFVNAIAAITGTVVTCTFPLQMPPPYPDRVSIVGNGMTIPRDPTHMNGWDFGAGNMSITFYGTYCQQLQQGVIVTVQAIFGCPPIGIHL